MNPAIALARTYLALSRPWKRRGFHAWMRGVRRLFPRAAREECMRTIDGAGVFAFPAGDAYWLSYFETGRRYEPELGRLLAQLDGQSVFFLDGGANFGYWSIVASTRVRHVLAVEASSETCRWLARNRAANDERFDMLQAALSDGHRAYVQFAVHHTHVGRSIVEDDAPGTETVPATTVDALVAGHAAPGEIVLVKLDVEGGEIAAFDGATHTLAGRSIFFYEDHRKHADSAVTAHLLALGLRIFHPSRDGTLRAVRSAAEASALKRTGGDNFVALGRAFDLVLPGLR